MTSLHQPETSIGKYIDLFPIRVNTVITATADLAHFINVACKIWAKTSCARDANSRDRDETETRRRCVSRPSRDRDVDTETTSLLHSVNPVSYRK